MKHAPIEPSMTLARGPRGEDYLRGGLLIAALAIGFFPLYRFLGSMIWFHQYLGDYQVFWAITKTPVEHLYDHRVFAYPPSALLLLWPFGALPFTAALIAWNIAGIAAIWRAFAGIIPRRALLIGLATFAGTGVIVGGQISLFIGALIIGALRATAPRWRGAALAAAALIKPQSLLAAPILLAATRDRKGVAWAALSGSLLLSVSVALVGAGPWFRWFTELPRFHAYLVSHGIDRLDVGVYGLSQGWGLPAWTFLAAAPLATLTTWLVFQSGADIPDRYAAFVVSTVLLSPYSLYYDLAGLTFVSVAMLLDRSRSPLIWLAAAMIVSSVFAVFGIILLAVALCTEALRRSRERAEDLASTQLVGLSAARTNVG